MFKARAFLSLLAIPLLALVIACSSGDDDDSPDAATGGGAGSTAGQSTGGSATGAQSTGSGGGGSATGAQSTGSSGPASTGAGTSGDFDAEDCPELQAFVDSAGVGDAFTGGGVPGQDFDPEDFQRLADDAPGEIKDDMQVLADALEEFFGALEDLEVDFSNPASFATLSAEDLAKLEQISASIDTPEVQAASERVEAYFDEICS